MLRRSVSSPFAARLGPLGLRVLSLVLVASSIVSTNAFAFCQKTSKGSDDPSYDPATQGGCEKLGVPIYWKEPCVDYKVILDRDGWGDDSGLALEAAEKLVEEEFQLWSTAACPGRFTARTTPNLTLRRKDLSGVGGCEGSVLVNEVRFTKCDPGKVDELGVASACNPSTLAVTYVKKRELSGVIEQSVMYVYPQAFVDKNLEQLRAVVRHEAGHFLGLAHSDQTSAIMYFQSQSKPAPGLTEDDVNGICEIYNRENPVGAGCSLHDAGSNEMSPWGPTLAAGIVGLTVASRRRRKRA
ncbi:MAG: matrixin family metalloprotease [Polyangiaceae bacterium]|nr:matrixin family metalloprotease [Polyangiaceae bacterium]